MGLGYDYADYNDLVLQSILSGAVEEHRQRIIEVALNGTGNRSRVEGVQQDEQIDLEAELFQGYPPSLLTIATVFCLLFMLVGIPGNLITIIALFRCKKVRNATAVFIINLSVSDLMSCCFNLPLAASTFWRRSWRHGLLLCRLFPLLRYGLLAVSLFTVLAITLNRYVMIGHPTMYPKLYRKQYLGLMVAATWLCGFGALVATWFEKWGKFGLDPRIGSCSILRDSTGNSPKEFLFLVAFVIPCICIVVCYARIFYIVRKTALKSRVAGRGHSSATSSNATSCKSYYGKVRLLRKCHNSSTEDSAFATSSTAPSFSTTEKSSTIDNGTELTELNIRIVTLPNPNLLSPPGASPRKVHADPSSSSGVEEGMEDITSRSATPTSVCSSRATSPKGRKHKERIPSAVNSTLNHVASVFRKTSQRCSPRRRTSGTPMPGKMTPKDKKLLKMILVIFAAFVTCYLPITLSKTHREWVDLPSLNIAGYIFIYLTTCINPIIYVVMSSEYRQAYKNLLMCRSSESQVNTASKP